MAEINHGVLLGNRATDWIGGTIPYKVENPSGDWTPYLPLGEWQSMVPYNVFDTMACVTFSALNVIETLYYFKTGYHRNFSDRFTAIMSGTTPSGNYLWKVGDSIRKDGLVDESDFPTDITKIRIWSDYYIAVPIPTIDKAKIFLQQFQVNYEAIDFTRDSLIYHLKQSPIQVVFPSHAVMNFFTDSQVYKYFDSYNPFVKGRTADFVAAQKYVLTPTMFNHLKFSTDTAQYLELDPFVLLHLESPAAVSKLVEKGVLSPDLVTLSDSSKSQYKKAGVIHINGSELIDL